MTSYTVQSSVADPDPNPDPHVFGPPGSGSTSQRYGSGSCCGSGYESFYPHAKIVRKTLIPTFLWLFVTLFDSFWLFITFYPNPGYGSEYGSISQRHGSTDPDPDPPENVMDPQHWCRGTAPRLCKKDESTSTFYCMERRNKYRKYRTK